ncbi:MAG TPA: hypothetical protein VKP67_28180 [Xanthobacteraceae bacterium]|nr:hypothetical protein [Xanthobacteraceae bacterium]
MSKHKGNRGQPRTDTQETVAPAAPDHGTFDTHAQHAGRTHSAATPALKPTEAMPSNALDHPSSDTHEVRVERTNLGGQKTSDAHLLAAADAPGQKSADTHAVRVGGDNPGGQLSYDNQSIDAASGVADQSKGDTQISGVRDAVLSIRIAHRRRRYAMKQQQGIDRRCESYIRSNYTDWRPDMGDDDRERIRKEVQAHLKRARSGEHEDAGLVELVRLTDRIREPVDLIRSEQERIMEKLAERLPGWSFVKSVKGAAALGFATIVAECSALNRETGEVTTLDDYANPSKVWKRLGFAPYDGRAGSTWKRDKWRPRALTNEEWIANPFSGERYALIIMIAESLFRHQWQSAEKAGTDEGQPIGPYGQLYADRRRVTAVTNPEWSKLHSKRDATRYMMKKYLQHLWSAWHDETRAARTWLKPRD